MKKSIIALIYLFVFTFLILLASPYIASSSWGTKQIANYLSKALKAHVELDHLSLEWFKEPTLEKFHYEKKEEKKSVIAHNLKFSKKLFLVFFKLGHLPKLEIEYALLEDRLDNNKGKGFFLPSAKITSFEAKIFEKETLAFQLKQTSLDYQLLKNSFYLDAKGTSVTSKQEGLFNFSLQGSPSLDILHVELSGTSFPSQALDYLADTKDLFKQLLGNMLQCQGKIHISKDQLYCDLETISANMKGSIHTKQEKDIVSLCKPSFISLTLDQKSFDRLGHNLVGLENLSLLNPGSLQLFLDDFKVPYENHKLDFDLLSYQARLFTSSFNFSIKNAQKNLAMSASTLSSFSRELGKELFFSLKTSFNYNQKNPCHIASSCSVAKPLDAFELSDLSATITKCPISVIEEIFKTKFSLKNLLGDNLDFSIESKPKDQIKNFYLSIVSPALNLYQVPLNYRDRCFTLLKQSKVYYTPLSVFQNLELPLAKINRIAPIEIAINELSVSHGNSWNDLLKDIQGKAQILCPEISLSSPLYFGSTLLKNLLWQVDLPHLHKMNYFGSFSLLGQENDPLQTLVFGPQLEVQYVSTFEKSPKEGWSVPIFELDGKSSQMAFHAEGKISSYLDKLTLLEPISITYLPASELFNKVFSVSPDLASYTTKDPLDLKLSASTFSLSERLFEDLTFSLQAKGGSIKLINKVTNKTFVLSLDSLNSKGSFADKSLTVEALAELKDLEKNDTGRLTFSFQDGFVENFAILKDPFTMKVEFDLCPTALLDTALGYNDALLILLGEKFSSSTSIEKKLDLYAILSDINSPQLRAHVELEKNKDFITLKNKKIEGDIFLKKDSYSALEQLFTPSRYSKQTFTLTREARLHFVIDRFKWLLHPQKTIKSEVPIAQSLLSLIHDHLEKSLLSAKVFCPDISIYNKETKQTVNLASLNIECTKLEGLTPFSFEITSKISNQSSSEGDIVALISLQNIVSDGKKVVNSKVDAKLKNFPTLLLDMGANLWGIKQTPPSLFLGNVINASFVSKLRNLQGTLDFTVSSDQCEGSLHALANDDVIKLIEPLKATIHITPELADLFLAKMNVALLSSSQPLELKIDNKGFYFPISPYSLDQFQIRNGFLSLGKISCKNRGNPEDIGGFFKLNLSSSSPISLWFAPTEFSLSNGIIYFDRTEILYNHEYQIAFWGKMDLNQQKVKMTLGLTEQSLQKALGIRGLPRSFVLQVPMEGPINNVRINKELATARIALLVAKTSGLTDYGGIWGGVASALHEFANDQTTVPPPKPPFPWQKIEKKTDDKVHIIK